MARPSAVGGVSGAAGGRVGGGVSDSPRPRRLRSGVTRSARRSKHQPSYVGWAGCGRVRVDVDSGEPTWCHVGAAVTEGNPNRKPPGEVCRPGVRAGPVALSAAGRSSSTTGTCRGTPDPGPGPPCGCCLSPTRVKRSTTGGTRRRWSPDPRRTPDPSGPRAASHPGPPADQPSHLPCPYSNNWTTHVTDVSSKSVHTLDLPRTTKPQPDRPPTALRHVSAPRRGHDGRHGTP